jgi:hypothetical protein
MPLISVIIVLIVVGVLLWLALTYIPMDATVKTIIKAVVIIAVVLWLLSVFGLLDSLYTVQTPHVRH